MMSVPANSPHTGSTSATLAGSGICCLVSQLGIRLLVDARGKTTGWPFDGAPRVILYIQHVVLHLRIST
jgi:hypothetical protein